MGDNELYASSLVTQLPFRKAQQSLNLENRSMESSRFSGKVNGENCWSLSVHITDHFACCCPAQIPWHGMQGPQLLTPCLLLQLYLSLHCPSRVTLKSFCRTSCRPPIQAFSPTKLCAPGFPALNTLYLPLLPLFGYSYL